MKLVNYRIAIERPSIGFPYFGVWHKEHVIAALRDAHAHWQLDAHANIHLQVSNGSGSPPLVILLSSQEVGTLMGMDPSAQKAYMRAHRIQLHAQMNKNAPIQAKPLVV